MMTACRMELVDALSRPSSVRTSRLHNLYCDPVERAGMACSKGGRRVLWNRGWLDQHTHHPKWRPWCAQIGLCGTERLLFGFGN